jgi:hypothetical protein
MALMVIWVMFITQPREVPLAVSASPPQKNESADPSEPVEDPIHPMPIEDLMLRVIQYGARFQKAASRSDFAVMIYDALRAGKLRCWGRQSYQYPPPEVYPPPLRKFIDPVFWQRNTIEDIDDWVQQGPPLDRRKTSPISKPDDAHDRARATCYWQIVFDPKQARKLWPNKDDWMSA